MTKVPATPRGFHDATTDPEQIAAWWSEAPDSNIAFSPHTIGQGIVDLDGAEGIAAWVTWCADFGGVGQTWTVRTPRGGFHLYFVGELPSSVKKLIPGEPVDTRGRGSYALLPPSVTEDGTYVVHYAVPPVPLPAFVAERAIAMRQKLVAEGDPDIELDQPVNLSRAVRHIIEHGQVREGFRNQTAFELACDLYDMGISESKALDMLEEWDSHNLPPLAEELALPVWSAYHGNSQNKAPGSKAVQPAAALLKEQDPPPPEPNLFTFRPPSQWSKLIRGPDLIEGILPAQGTGILYAPPGSFKSFIALGLAFAVASGLPAFGRHKVSRTGPVVYCAGEGHLAVATKRLPALFLSHTLPVADETPFYLMNGVPLARGDQIAAAFVKAIREQIAVAPAFVVIDTMARSLAGLKENDATEAGQFVTLIEAVASELGCMVLGVAHEGKDASKGVRGSSAIEAGVDVIWQARRPSETSPGVSLHSKKDKDGEAPGVIYLMGSKAEGSMVFAAVDGGEWMKGSGKRPGMVTPSDVGHALDDLGAREGTTVTTTVLAEELAGPSADEATVKAKKVALGRGIADGCLLPYVVHMAENTRDPALWSIPANISTD